MGHPELLWLLDFPSQRISIVRIDDDGEQLWPKGVDIPNFVLAGMAAPCFLICSLAMGQQSPAPVPDLPVQSQTTQTAQQPSNPIQSGVVLFKLLQQKSLVFPDLANG